MAARIITVFNQKGGVGKTRLSSEIAGTLALRGHRSLYVDLDQQSTGTRSASQASEESPFPATVTNLSDSKTPHIEIRKQLDIYDYVVIDCPPSVEAKLPSIALLISDLGIIPVGGSGGQLWASMAAKQLGMEAQVKNPTLKLRFVANMVNRTVLMRDVIAQLEADEDVALMKTRISDRNVFCEAETVGQVVMQITGKNDPARKEVDLLVDEVLTVLDEEAE